MSGHLKITQNGQKRGVWLHAQAFTPHMSITQHAAPTSPLPAPCSWVDTGARSSRSLSAVELDAADMMGVNKANLFLMLVYPFHSWSLLVPSGCNQSPEA